MPAFLRSDRHHDHAAGPPVPAGGPGSEPSAAGCPAFEPVRRRDRAVEDEAWIAELLCRAPVGTLALVEDGQPFVNTNIFVFDPEARAIYLHTARRGRTPDHVAAGEGAPGVSASFTVFEMGRLLPADAAIQFSTEFKSVVAFGQARPLTGPAATAALHRLMAKYAPHLAAGIDYRPVDARDLKRTQVIAFEIASWSGTNKEVAPDFPGAYRFDEVCLPHLTGAAAPSSTRA